VISFPDKKYQIIYADPAWKYNFGETSSRFVNKKYTVMEKEEIMELPVKDISDDNCVLLLWVTFPKLNWSFDIFKYWNFEYKTCAFVWIKTNKNFCVNQRSFLPSDCFDTFTGLGYYTRSNAEICLLGTKGKPPERKCHNINQVVYEPVQEHSKKPSIVRKHIVSLFGDLPRIELFARQKTEGWDVWGNEV